jgi:hypothetical protein
MGSSWRAVRLAAALAATLMASGLLLPSSADAFRGTGRAGKGAGAAAPSRLGAPQQSPKGAYRGTSRQGSGPMTFGYWNGSQWVRTPGPWTAPNTGSRPSPQRLR